VKELENGEELVVLKYPGWWIRNNAVIGFGQISPKGGLNHVLWGTSAGGVWTPATPGTVYVISGTDARAPVFGRHNFARTIRRTV